MNANDLGTLNHTISLLKEGDLDAFRVLYDRHFEVLTRRLQTFLHDDILVQEVVQDTFVQVWLKRETIDPAKDFLAWISTIAKRKSIDILRRQVKLTLAMDELKAEESYEPSAEQALIQREEHEKLSRLLDVLPEQQRQVLMLAKLHELSYQEIADKMKISKNTVKNHLVKAMKVLKYRTTIFFIFFLF
ncbi:RNA polymerase sigma factor [Sphingobacterium gobiense]|uniref:RNA polymerase sigma factor n=1 Tax=Sphingobacterium gobiense TaxID=1382456 RepID=A0A2S9JS01_9SPHI|nr:sigma-70 family RNA polymerase sigma factor [Sphingobacterium gobiense]PRD56077.1 hypothetical protein C5749_02000 [Sphingobacterium gobiense]